MHGRVSGSAFIAAGICAGLFVAGCSSPSSAKPQTAPTLTSATPSVTETATPTTEPVQPLDVSARLACLGTDDALTSFHNDATALNEELFVSIRWLSSVNSALQSSNSAVRSYAQRLAAGHEADFTSNLQTAKDRAAHVLSVRFLENAKGLRDVCVGQGWQSQAVVS